MTENPGAVIEEGAKRKVTPRAVVEALPEKMGRLGAGSSSAPP